MPANKITNNVVNCYKVLYKTSNWYISVNLILNSYLNFMPSSSSTPHKDNTFWLPSKIRRMMINRKCNELQRKNLVTEKN